jgi:hypothetical protein
MAARTNIVIEESDKSRVYLYAHNNGDQSLRAALIGLSSDRANDPSYLARIIFSVMIEDHLHDEEGFGISAKIGDNEAPVLVISPQNDKSWFEFESKIVSPAFSLSSMTSLLDELQETAELTYANLIEMFNIKNVF